MQVSVLLFFGFVSIEIVIYGQLVDDGIDWQLVADKSLALNRVRFQKLYPSMRKNCFAELAILMYTASNGESCGSRD